MGWHRALSGCRCPGRGALAPGSGGHVLPSPSPCLHLTHEPAVAPHGPPSWASPSALSPQARPRRCRFSHPSPGPAALTSEMHHCSLSPVWPPGPLLMPRIQEVCLSPQLPSPAVLPPAREPRVPGGALKREGWPEAEPEGAVAPSLLRSRSDGAGAPAATVPEAPADGHGVVALDMEPQAPPSSGGHSHGRQLDGSFVGDPTSHTPDPQR